MNIRIHQGTTTVTLTKTEQGALRKARDICAGLCPYDPEADAVTKSLGNMIHDHCDEPEPATP